MPIYEYECIPNKHRFEVIQKFSDPPVAHCTVCGEPVQKLLSPPAIQFKGSGWYITDYARKGSSTGESRESKAASSENKSGETNSGSKSTENAPATGTSDSSSKKESS